MSIFDIDLKTKLLGTIMELTEKIYLSEKHKDQTMI